MKKKVIAAGHICIDITPVFPDEKVENWAISFTGKTFECGKCGCPYRRIRGKHRHVYA